jgi:CrcB protein
MTVVATALAAAAGAMVRFRLSPFGWRATLVVNLVGSFVLGVLLATRSSTSDLVTVLGTGFCGSLTTFGTFALEASTGPARLRLTVVATNLAGCVAAASAGFALG